MIFTTFDLTNSNLINIKIRYQHRNKSIIGRSTSTFWIDSNKRVYANGSPAGNKLGSDFSNYILQQEDEEIQLRDEELT